jgi:ADP-heptose:LPS heptosyltransferase
VAALSAGRASGDVLVLRALWLGDLLTIVPCLRALANAFPERRRLLAAPAVLAPLVELAAAGFEVIDAAPLAPLPAACRRPSVAFNLHGRGPESHRVLLRTGPGRLVAFRHPEIPETHHAPSWDPHEHEVRRWCRLVAESGVPADPTRLRLRRPAPLPEYEGVTVLHAGAKALERRWPPARWAAVARAESGSGRRVVLTGSRAERPVAREIAARAGIGDEAVLAGRTDLGQLTAIVGHARKLLSADTGVAHLATALGTPSVTLFGPTPPRQWGPLIDGELHRVIWKGPTEHGTDGRPHPALLDVRAEEVVAAARALPS